MKTKGNNSDVAHYWANQNQESLSNANGSFYYNGDIIFSYGSHFPIARHLNNIVLMTTGSYSNTTGKHISLVNSAISHKTIFNVVDVMACNKKQHENNFSDYNERFIDTIKKAVRARSNKSWLLESAERLANEANDYAEYFDLDIVKIDVGQLDMDSIKETLKQEKIERAKQAKIKAKQLLIEQSENIEKWRNGERVYSSLYQLPCMLRINKENETIETSQGANIPLSFAPKLWRYIQHCIKNKVSFSDSFRVGHYSLNGIDKNGNIKVGCHNIKYNELLLIAKQLKLA